MRCTLTGPAAPRCWAKSDSRSSSSIQRTATSRGGVLPAWGSVAPVFV